MKITETGGEIRWSHRPNSALPRENSPYCLQPGSHCHTCSLVNYGRDCRNNPVEDSGATLT